MFSFEYLKPKSLEEAMAIYKGAVDPIYMAGGMTLIATMKQRLAQPSDVIDLSQIKGLNDICQKDKTIFIGAMTTHATVGASENVKEYIPALSALAGEIGDPQLRVRGTLGGSIANADPSADYPASLLALDATISTHSRQIKADDFFTDLFETALETGELITGVSFKIPKRASYQKFSNPASRYAIVGVFVAEFEDVIRVGITGAGTYAIRWHEAEKALSKNLNASSIEDLTFPDEDLNEDIHASKSYRASLVKTMTKRAVNEILGVT
jgi:aerobic carbon-monoxide dehydrogenase medium subunit